TVPNGLFPSRRIPRNPW
ncbi:pyridoxal-dependent decarboxylase, C-terminal sheet domain protein, partial [Vibrio parahaemolyticus V-223/04]